MPNDFDGVADKGQEKGQINETPKIPCETKVTSGLVSCQIDKYGIQATELMVSMDLSLLS